MQGGTCCRYLGKEIELLAYINSSLFAGSVLLLEVILDNFSS